MLIVFKINALISTWVPNSHIHKYIESWDTAQQEVRNKRYGVKCGSQNAYASDSTDKEEESSIPKSTISQLCSQATAEQRV